MASISRYQDAAGHVFSVTAEEAAQRGYKPFAGNAETGSGAVAAPEAPAAEPDASTPEPEAELPKHVGGGYYELSNGDHVQGKDNAAELQAVLNAEGSTPKANRKG